MPEPEAAVVDAVRHFVEREVTPVASQLERADAYPHTIIERMKQMGVFGLRVPDAYGGLGALTATEALARLDAAGIANAALRTVEQFAAHPQLRARRRWHDVPSVAGPVRMLLPPVDSSEWDHHIGAVPELGQHTGSILHELRDTPDPDE